MVTLHRRTREGRQIPIGVIGLLFLVVFLGEKGYWLIPSWLDLFF